MDYKDLVRLYTEPEYEVFPYSFEKLQEQFALKSLPRSVNRSGAELSAGIASLKTNFVQGKQNCAYLEKFFIHSGNSNQITVVAENRYVDADHLADYSEYYVRCFNRYNRHCVRLHFFSEPFDTLSFKKVLLGGNRRLLKKIKNNYLGFIVIRPLPETIIGRTCLAPVQQNAHFPVLKKYKASLFGIKLKVDSLAFQEQDSVVAVCATSAIWSAFQKTSQLFQHELLSPAQITKVAGSMNTANVRMLNARGLDTNAIRRSLKALSLESLILKPSSQIVFKQAIHAYIEIGIPIIMGLQLLEIDKNTGHTIKHIGAHAVTITGYSTKDMPSPIKTSENARASSLRLYANRIDELYVHDDQIGPYAPMRLDDKSISLLSDAMPENIQTEMLFDNSIRALVNTGKGHIYSVSSEHQTVKDTCEVRAIPYVLIVPHYHKIRVHYDVIYAAILRFEHSFLAAARAQKIYTEKIEWKINLSTVQKIKKALICEPRKMIPEKHQILVKSLPKYIWHCKGYCADDRVAIELLFDATDIEQGDLFILGVLYDKNLAELLIQNAGAFVDEARKQLKPDKHFLQILAWFHTNREKLV